ncbi:MAG: hypothetical protein AAF517_09460 [Planctomycetota bacterium]
MPPALEWTIVGLVLLLAVAYIVRVAVQFAGRFRQTSEASCGSGCGSSGCGPGGSAETTSKPRELVQPVLIKNTNESSGAQQYES